MIVSGVVDRVLRHGLLVSIDNSPLKAFVKQEDCADTPIADLSSVYAENDRVKLVVLRVDAKKRRIDASMRASLLPTDTPFAFASTLPSSAAAPSQDADTPLADADSDEFAAVQDFDEAALQPKNDEDNDEEAKNSMETAEPMEAEDGMEVEDSLAASAPSSFSLGFGWDDFAPSPAASLPASSSSSFHPSASKRPQLREAEIAAKERSLASQSAQPASEADFERLLVSQPTSSELWIRYASWFLSLADPGKARAVLRRALQSVPGHLEDERANLWLALLNLESEFGDEAALREVFKEARQAMEPRRAGLHLASLLEAKQRWAEVYAVWKQLAKENRGDVKVWLGWCECFLKQSLPRESGETLKRAQEAVGKSEKARLLSGYAILLYRYGQSDQGRTIFEDLVSTLKNRLDLWNLYVDQETKAGNVEYVRGLFGRMVELKMSVNSAKRVFKKWIAFEDAHGDEEHAAKVEEIVQQYIDRLTTKE